MPASIAIAEAPGRNVSQGALRSSPVPPREVFGPAVREGGNRVGIHLLNHSVAGVGAYGSLADRDLV